MRSSSRVAFGVAWVVYLAAGVHVWRKVLSVPDGAVTGLFVATVCGGAGLGLLGWWLSAHERPPTAGDE